MTGSFIALFWVRLKLRIRPVWVCLIAHVPHLAPQFPLLVFFFSEDAAHLEFLQLLQFQECVRMV